MARGGVGWREWRWFAAAGDGALPSNAAPGAAFGLDGLLRFAPGGPPAATPATTFAALRLPAGRASPAAAAAASSMAVGGLAMLLGGWERLGGRALGGRPFMLRRLPAPALLCALCILRSRPRTRVSRWEAAR